MPLQHAADGVVEQVRGLGGHALEQQRAVFGDAQHGPFKIAQFQPQQPLRPGRQRRTLALRRFLAALEIVGEHDRQADGEQDAQADTQPHDRTQWPRQCGIQRGHCRLLPLRWADFMRNASWFPQT
ncbi:hypothetical protein D3C72_2136940 [compost metagenome]